MNLNYKKITKAPYKEKLKSFITGYEEKLKKFYFFFIWSFSYVFIIKAHLKPL